MAHIPEELIQELMRVTGMSRKEAENQLVKSLHEMTSGPAFNFRTFAEKSNTGSRPKYSRAHYPDFLPSEKIRKCTVRVSLRGIAPPIWRKFECPSNISLRHLTELVILLMGWENEHFNQIAVGTDTFYVPFYQHDSDMDFGDNRYQEEYMLSDLLREKGKKIRWEYNFGDSWNHEIRLSSIEEYKADEPHDIVFKGGKRACPPEDCGGNWGYHELLETFYRRKAGKRLKPEEKERLEWYNMDRNFDPEFFAENRCIEICKKFSCGTDGATQVTGDANLADKEEHSAIPTVPLYDEVLSIAFRIRQLEPWEELDDSDVFAIRMQDGSDMYVSILGNGGTTYDVQLYDGQEDFQTYLFTLKSSTLPEFEILESHAWTKFRSVMFEDPADEIMLPSLYHHIEEWAKSHNVKIEAAHGYPFLQIFRPHRAPFIPSANETELARMKEALQAVEWLSRLLPETGDLTTLGFKEYREYPSEKGGKVVPLIVLTPYGYKVERTKLPGLITSCDPVILPEKNLQPLRFLQKSGTKFIRLIHLPGMVGTEDDPENAYKPMTLIIVDKGTDFVDVTEVVGVSETYELETLRHYIIRLLKDARLPQRIIVDDFRTESILKDFCRRLGVVLERSRTRIPQLTRACQYMYDMK